ncbi:SDR family oxidoreductase [Allokutzneria sp. A3M-2-11 16]|uniref:SDR family NAD(P)-dependent oxidoreductase n=1 Tax=Allokutzneria sp. A3M-2-11 16 TaxID=2962043 RepID=UPI0020B71B4A|nr:SDR family NAD(P)-dependent oxidoreductase [Allokutzneria sp. A3M-2-11 16]MCP3805264.1 SDR family oxidoreductase [Allokutzneria sp. A3M-2-11 16]
MFGLEGRTVLVTGASRGIGRAIALACAEVGADVALLARGTDALREVAEIVEKLGRRALVLTCDAGDEDQVRAAVADTVAQFGRLDVLVNNAGGFGFAGPFLELTARDWADAIRLNLDSVVHFCRAAGRVMVRQRSGSLINIGSVSGVGGVPMLSHYAAVKAAVVSLTRSLAAEWAASGVRVNCVVPGWITTELTRAMSGQEEVSEGLLRAVPARRWGDPEDVAGAVVYLAGDAAKLTTGSCLTLDGGMTSTIGGPTLIDMLEMGRIPV